MNETQIRQLIKDEIRKQTLQTGAPNIYPHTHDGVNNALIPESSIQYPPAILGKINFARNTTYTLYFNHQNPTRIDLNGDVFNGSNDSNAIIVGVAILNSAFYFQPLSTSAAKEGGSQYPINGVLAQCSTNLFLPQTAGGVGFDPFPHVDQFFIANAFSGAGSHLVTAELANLTKTSIDVIITNLASGYTLAANFIIT